MNENIEWIDPYEETEEMKNFRKHLEFSNRFWKCFVSQEIMIKTSNKKEEK